MERAFLALTESGRRERARRRGPEGARLPAPRLSDDAVVPGRVRRRPAGDRGPGGDVRLHRGAGRPVGSAGLQRRVDRLLRVRDDRRRHRHRERAAAPEGLDGDPRGAADGHAGSAARDADVPDHRQAGSAAFDLFFIPVRMAVLLLAVAVTLGLGFAPGGSCPASCCSCASCRSSGVSAWSPRP